MQDLGDGKKTLQVGGGWMGRKGEGEGQRGVSHLDASYVDLNWTSSEGGHRTISFIFFFLCGLSKSSNTSSSVYSSIDAHNREDNTEPALYDLQDSGRQARQRLWRRLPEEWRDNSCRSGSSASPSLPTPRPFAREKPPDSVLSMAHKNGSSRRPALHQQ